VQALCAPIFSVWPSFPLSPGLPLKRFVGTQIQNMKGLRKEFFDFILLCVYYPLFIRPRSVAKIAPEWDIDLSAMKAVYRGPQVKDQSPFAGMSMTFYIAGDGEGGKTLCGGLDPIPAAPADSLVSALLPLPVGDISIAFT
jgi:hypothetical protein